jgi:nickel transport protein
MDRRLDADGLAVEFYLSTGEPVTQARFQLFGPGDDVTAFQDGRTDRLGRAVFLPDRPGTWRIALTDDLGHSSTSAIEVGAEQAAPQQPFWQRWLLRLSLLGNFVMIGLLLHTWLSWRWQAAEKRRDAARMSSHDHDLHDHGLPHTHTHGLPHTHGHGHAHDQERAPA